MKSNLRRLVQHAGDMTRMCITCLYQVFYLQYKQYKQYRQKQAIMMQYIGRNADISYFISHSRSWCVFSLRSTQRADVRKAGTSTQRGVPKEAHVRSALLSKWHRGKAGARLGQSWGGPISSGTRHSQKHKGR